MNHLGPKGSQPSDIDCLLFCNNWIAFLMSFQSPPPLPPIPPPYSFLAVVPIATNTLANGQQYNAGFPTSHPFDLDQNKAAQ